jgi:hypothetical protein
MLYNMHRQIFGWNQWGIARFWLVKTVDFARDERLQSVYDIAPSPNFCSKQGHRSLVARKSFMIHHHAPSILKANGLHNASLGVQSKYAHFVFFTLRIFFNPVTLVAVPLEICFIIRDSCQSFEVSYHLGKVTTPKCDTFISMASWEHVLGQKLHKYLRKRKKKWLKVAA